MPFNAAVTAYYTTWADRSGTVKAVTNDERDAAVAIGCQKSIERFGPQDGTDTLVALDAFVESVAVLRTLTTLQVSADDERWLDAMKKQRDELYRARFQKEFLPVQGQRKKTARNQRMYPFSD